VMLSKKSSMPLVSTFSSKGQCILHIKAALGCSVCWCCHHTIYGSTLHHIHQNLDQWSYYHAQGKPFSSLWELQLQIEKARWHMLLLLFFWSDGAHIHGTTRIDKNTLFSLSFDYFYLHKKQNFLEGHPQSVKTEMMSPVHHWPPHNTGWCIFRMSSCRRPLDILTSLL
jgi:hypothetical protein